MKHVVANAPRYGHYAVAFLFVVSLGMACEHSGLNAGADASPGGSTGTSMAGTSALGGSSGAGGVSSLGGTNANGGSIGGTSGSASCPDAEACGGDVAGTWIVTSSSCLTVTGWADFLSVGLTCTRARVEGALQVTGAWSALANGTYSDKTTTTGSVQYWLDEKCATLMGTRVRCVDLIGLFLSMGFSTASCEDAADGGCTCAAELEQTASMGTVTYAPMTGGSYNTSGSKLTFDDGNPYAYCVSGDHLTIAPQNPALPTTGAIVFEKE